MVAGMTGLLLALLATVLAGLGARDQMLVAHLSQRQGARPALLLVAAVSGACAAAIAAAGGGEVAALLGSGARRFLVAIALGLAGIELLARRPRPLPAEPTHSLGAFALVAFTMQLTDAARFLVFAIAALTSAPLAAGVGGAVGAVLAVSAGWSGLILADQARLPLVRSVLGAVLILLALGIGLSVIAAR